MQVKSIQMNYIIRKFSKLVQQAVFAMLTLSSAIASPVWHCSRSDVQLADASDNFTLASLSLEREVIRLSLRDLYDVYKGKHVKLSGNLTLSACITKDVIQTSSIMKTIGAESGVSQILANGNKHAISAIYVVEGESEMQACITQHHPAVGYLPEVKNTEALGPCF